MLLYSFDDPVIEALDEKELKLLREILIDDEYKLKNKLINYIDERLENK